jgi:teichuronic acid exporter
MSIKHKVYINTFWSIGGQVGISIIQLAANIIFARFLTPNEFGQLSIVMFFVLLANVLVEGGLGGALVRKIDATERDFTTVFIFNLFVSLLFYLILLLNAGNIARYYDNLQLKNILIVTGFVLFLNSLNFVQNTRLVKNLHFKKIMAYRLIAFSISNGVGVILVINGFGIWSLVISILINPIVLAVLYWFREGPIGTLIFSKTSFKGLYAFGINTSLATIIDTLFNNIYQLILGKYFSISEAGIFFQAKKLQDVPNTIIFGTTNSVIFSSLAKLQDKPSEFIELYNRIVLYFSIVMGFISMITIIYARDIILLLYGQKWIASSTYLTLLALASFFYIHEMFNRVIFKTYDKTKIILQLEVLKKSLLIVSVILGIVYLNIKILLIGYVIISIVSYLINYFFSRKITNIHSWDELIVILKIFVSILVTSLLMYFIRMHYEPGNIYIILSIPFVISAYLFLLRILGLKYNTKLFFEFFRLWKESKGLHEN